MNILLIEPDKKLGGIYQRGLEASGHDVQWAGHAQDAVYAADDTKPDLIVLELSRMAGNTGYSINFSSANITPNYRRNDGNIWHCPLFV
jgi:DNA-binding response OmpR family regulator